MKDKNNKPTPKSLRLIAISSQMLAIVCGSALLGRELDRYFQVEKHYFTLVLSLLGVFLGLFKLFRDLKKLNIIE